MSDRLYYPPIADFNDYVCKVQRGKAIPYRSQGVQKITLTYSKFRFSNRPLPRAYLRDSGKTHVEVLGDVMVVNTARLKTSHIVDQHRHTSSLNISDRRKHESAGLVAAAIVVMPWKPSSLDSGVDQRCCRAGGIWPYAQIAKKNLMNINVWQ